MKCCNILSQLVLGRSFLLFQSKLIFLSNRCNTFLLMWRPGVVVITIAQLHSTKPEYRLFSGSNPARGVSEISDGEDLWLWFRLEISLNAFCSHKNNSSSSSSLRRSLGQANAVVGQENIVDEIIDYWYFLHNT